MNKSFNPPKYLIILGTNYSGTSAVFDYFSGRGDLYDPLNGEEYQLPQLPNGLMSLEAAASSAFNPSSIEYALSKFEDLTNKLVRSKTFWCSGKGYGKKLPFFEDSVKNFINNICIVNFPINLDWRKLLISTPERLIFQFKEFLGLNNVIPQARLVVSKNELISLAQKMHDEIFQPNANNRPVLIDMASSGWNPYESTKFFLDCKVVIVIRDPRDQFFDLKKYKKASSVKDFVKWYKQMQKHLLMIDNKLIMKVRFENFVNNNKDVVKKFCNHVSLPINISSSYQPDLSKKNIGKYKSHLNQNEIDTIEKELLEYCYNE